MNGTELVFKKPGEASEEESDGEGPLPLLREEEATAVWTEQRLAGDSTRITIVEDD